MPTYIRLTDYKSSDEKEKGFFDPKNRYEAKQEDFEKIPGSPIAYWVSDKNNKVFNKSIKLSDIDVPVIGIASHNDDYFLKLWNEVDFEKIGLGFQNRASAKDSKYKWFPHNKGGTFRKWYGNNEYVVNYENDGQEIKDFPKGQTKNEHKYFSKGMTWSRISSSAFSVRFHSNGFIMGDAGPSAFAPDDKILYILSCLNSKLTLENLLILNPTMNYQVGNISNLPIIFSKDLTIKQKIDQLTQQNIDISKEEWDSRETSWDFTKNELLKHKQDSSLENALQTYETYWSEQFKTLHTNEEELNRLFIEIYELKDELTPDVALEDITILKNEAKIENGKLVFQNKEIIKQFISYGVGCMFGRYTLDQEGLVVANQNQAIPTDTTFEIDDDNIIPIVDESDYFSDDMTDRFTEFVRITFGSEKLQQNIAFIEAALGKKLRAYFMKDFYVDHVKRYKKRPIYWLFSSPKATFQVLIYMHRYTPDTCNQILNDYLRPFRIRLDTMREEALRITESESVTTREKNESEKKIDKIDKTLDDINEYEKLLAHYAAQRIEIDLDDGVKVNYCKFKELLFEFDKKLCKK